MIDFPDSPVRLTRGDTAHLKFQRLDINGDPIIVRANEVYFTVKKSTKAPGAVLQKTLSDMTFDGEGVYHFTIAPDETDRLGYGEYVYDVEVIVNGEKTTIAKSPFIVREEVTFVTNEV